MLAGLADPAGGVRYALDPEAEVPPGLNERAIARIEREARELEEATRWWDLPILGALVAIVASQDHERCAQNVTSDLHSVNWN